MASRDTQRRLLTQVNLSQVEPPEENEKDRASKGFHYLEKAATAGERSSLVYVARAFDTGLNLPEGVARNPRKALEMYEAVCEADAAEGDSSLWGLDDAPYMLIARQAEMWLEGGEGLDKDPNKAGDLYNDAAEAAMNSMKGKLANKYYMLAEEAYGQCEEE